MRAPKSFGRRNGPGWKASLTRCSSRKRRLGGIVKLYAEAAALTDYCRATLEKASLQLDEIDAKRTAAPQPEADN